MPYNFLPEVKLMATQVAEILELSISERLQIVEDIWDSIASDSKDLYISDELKRELDRRMEAYEKNPNAGITWEELDERLANLR